MVSQKKMVLDYIREFGSITPIEAFRDMGITRLSAIVFILKEEGHDIKADIEIGRSRFGNLTRYARYSFGKDEGNENQAR